MLRVAIDATPLVGDRTGVGKAVTGMVLELATHRELSLVGYGLTARGWRRLNEVLPREITPARGPMPARPLMSVWARSNAAPIEWWTGRVDVVHGTNYVVPPATRAARVVTVADLTAVRYPEMCTPTTRRYPRLVERAIRTGSWVHTGASSVAKEIIDHFGVDPSKVRVIPPGMDPLPELTPVDRTGPPYILAMGRTEPRKDMAGLVRAFDLVAPDHPDVQLLIAGPPGWAEHQVLSAIERSPFRDRIKRLGYVSDADRLIAGASVFAYPSIYEGFGYPPLEAMALGVPVVATAAGAVPEVSGDAAWIVPPGDPDAFAAGIDRLLQETDLRRTLIHKGRERASGYTWEAVANGMSSLYAEMAASK